MNGRILFFFLNILVPLLMGSSIYFIWRLEILPEKLHIPKPPAGILYNLPDFLWLFALLQSMRLIWLTDKRIWFWFILSTLLSIGSEVLQLLEYIPGTFDYGDITAYLMAFLLVSIQTSIPQLKQFQYENIL